MRRVLLPVLAVLACPATASATTVSVDPASNTVRVTDPDGVANALEVSGVTNVITLGDTAAPLTAQAPCDQLEPGLVRCPGDEQTRVLALLGGGDDTAGGVSFAGRVTIDGGPGTDTLGPIQKAPTILRGGDGADRLLGAAGSDRLEGGPGADAMAGGAGDDQLLGGAGADTADAGDGDDWVDVGRDGGTADLGAGDDVAIGPLDRRRTDCGEGFDALEGLKPGRSRACEAVWLRGGFAITPRLVRTGSGRWSTTARCLPQPDDIACSAFAGYRLGLGGRTLATAAGRRPAELFPGDTATVRFRVGAADDAALRRASSAIVRTGSARDPDRAATVRVIG